jgi:thiol-disulfide isomerase/thioredoxin
VNPKSRVVAIVGAVVLVVAVVFGIALLATSGGDDDGDAAGSNGEPASTVESASADAGGDQSGETRTVDVIGDPLPPFEEGTDPAVGTPAPVLEGEAYDGSEITIGGPTDGPTMVVFLAHWCPHCNAEIPELIALEQSGDLPDDLNVIAVATAVDPTRPNYPPSAWLDEKGWPWPAMADDDQSTAMVASGGTSFPYTMILDADGNVLARKTGESSADESLAWIQQALA